jgi:hypothetical protein
MTTLEQVRAAPANVAAAQGMLWPGLIAVVAALVRLPFMTQPLSPDEGGHLLVASQGAQAVRPTGRTSRIGPRCLSDCSGSLTSLAAPYRCICSA